MTPHIFYRGLRWQEYFASMESNRELLRRKCAEFRLPPEERARWATSLVAYVLVFSEDWCQDSISALPPLLAIANVASFEMRIMRRSEELMLQRVLTKNEWPSVPLFIFYDAEWKELGRFVEKAREFRRIKNDPLEAIWLKEMYDEIWWETELAELAEIASSHLSRA